MPQLPDAIPVFVGTDTSWQTSTSTWGWSTGGINVTYTTYYKRLITRVTYKVPFYLTTPGVMETGLNANMSGSVSGYTFENFRNEIRSDLPALGYHHDTFVSFGTWEVDTNP